MRKNILPFILLISFLGFSQNKEIQQYVDYLKKVEKKSAKDYIIEKFENHDIVVLCERDHRDLSQYELIKEVLSDDYFKKNVKNVYTEIGGVNLQPEITEFLKIKGLDSLYVKNKLAEFQRNASIWAIWENYNYHYLLKTIYDINSISENKISFYPSGVEFDWSTVKNIEDYSREQDYSIEFRDSIMAYNIINKFEKLNSKENTKALVIMSYRHAFKIHTFDGPELMKNTTKYLFDYFGDRATNVLINQTHFVKVENEYVFSLIQKGKWDAAFKSLGFKDIGFDFKNNVFGKDKLDIWDTNTDLLYKDAFDGFVFYKPIEDYKLVFNFDGLIPKDAEEEYIRRFKINSIYNGNKSIIKKLESDDFRKLFIKELNTKKEVKYPYLEQLIKDRDKYLSD